jgi:hypothetical protein
VLCLTALEHLEPAILSDLEGLAGEKASGECVSRSLGLASLSGRRDDRLPVSHLGL